jgi:thymidylate synthase
MHTIFARNVNDAYHKGLSYLLEAGEREPSRAGPVLVAPSPVTTIYERPGERVLFSPKRDANCFFHLCEGLTMLAGRKDAAILNRYVRDFGERFAEPDGDIHDGYGYRWRHAFGIDQLGAIIARFRADPGTRQCVLTMWDPRCELIDSGGILWTCGENDLEGVWRTRPCNTHAYFRIRDGALNMMVCCRSNDMIFGGYGANAVHFSILQEYLAAMVGVRLGSYAQMSFNFHAYEDMLAKVGVPELDDRYGNQDGISSSPLVHDPSTFDRELMELLAFVDNDDWRTGGAMRWHNYFLRDTALPMLRAHSRWRAGARERALDGIDQVAATDWRVAAGEWIERRLKR